MKFFFFLCCGNSFIHYFLPEIPDIKRREADRSVRTVSLPPRQAILLRQQTGFLRNTFSQPGLKRHGHSGKSKFKGKTVEIVQPLLQEFRVGVDHLRDLVNDFLGMSS